MKTQSDDPFASFTKTKKIPKSIFEEPKEEFPFIPPYTINEEAKRVNVHPKPKKSLLELIPKTIVSTK